MLRKGVGIVSETDCERCARENALVASEGGKHDPATASVCESWDFSSAVNRVSLLLKTRLNTERFKIASVPRSFDERFFDRFLDSRPS